MGLIHDCLIWFIDVSKHLDTNLQFIGGLCEFVNPGLIEYENFEGNALGTWDLERYKMCFPEQIGVGLNLKWQDILLTKVKLGNNSGTNKVDYLSTSCVISKLYLWFQ